MIILIGVAHVFSIRDRLKEEILRVRPSVVCLELDALRYQFLVEERRRKLSKERGGRAGFDWRTIGRGGLIIALLAWKQGSLAKQYGSTAGDEMFAAMEAAQQLGAPTRLIDMDTRQLMRNWMGKLSRRERAKLFLSAVASIFASRKKVEKEIEEYFDDEDAFARDLAAEFPHTKTALIDDRNAYMARKIEAAKEVGPVVVAVVGAGHVTGIRDELLKGGEPAEQIRVIGLHELQLPSGGPVDAPGNAEFTLTLPPPGK
jgi:pheromone shutdown protein TraB